MPKSKKNTHFILIFELWNSFDIWILKFDIKSGINQASVRLKKLFWEGIQ